MGTEAARDTQKFAAPEPGAKPVKILIVDDQSENLLSAEAVLESLGQEIVRAQSGREALRHLLTEDFAVILLDVMMPDMDGFETAELIRERERSRTTPIIFVTALGKSEEHIFRGYDVGAVDYLTKPIVPEILRSKVAVFVELARKNAQLIEHADLLERKNRELQNANAQLREADQEIGRLNNRLERRVEELSDLNRELDAFGYTVSHDLRAPMIRIDGFTRALEEHCGQQLDEQARLYIHRVRTSSQRMCQLVDDLLNFSRVSRLDLRPQFVDLTEMAAGIAAELQSREPDRRVHFVIAPRLAATGDSALLRIVLVNLVENSWKFTRKRETAEIEFGITYQDGVDAFFLKDDGAGFDPKYRDKLFRPFERLHPNAEFEGTGIGLATVERIIRRHGGRVWAEGDVDRGATFYFTLQSGEKV
jgi:two-component system, sensor histidine kinase and response regulator